MTQLVHGSLTLVGANTSSPTVFWKGKLVPDIKAIRVDWDKVEHFVQLRVYSIDPPLEAELRAAGITVRKVRHHV